MNTTLFKQKKQPDPQQIDSAILQTWREDIFNRIVTIAATAGIALYLANVIALVQNEDWEAIALYTGAYLWLLASAFLKVIPAKYRAVSFVTMVFALGVLSSLQTLTVGDGRVWFLTSAVLAVIFLNRTAGLIFTALITAVWIGIGYLFSQEFIAYPYQQMAAFVQRDNFSVWTTTGVALFVAALTVVSSVATLLRNLVRTLEESQQLTKELESQSSTLKEQSQALERRSAAVESSSEISRAVAPLLDTQEIIEQSAKLILQNFNLYHVGVFIFTSDREMLDLKVSEGHVEHVISTANQQIDLIEDMVGTAITNRRAEMHYDGDGKDATSLLKIRLPNTRSYAVIPLRGSDDVLGALVLQSENLDTFDADVLANFQMLSDQIGMYLENARLLQEREEALVSERRAYGELTQSAWRDYASSKAKSGYRRDAGGGKMVVAEEIYPNGEQVERQHVSIKIRGQLIGYVNAQKSDGQAWTSNEKALLATLTTQLETVMDSARLYTETQNRAAQERMVGSAAAKMRETLDIESVLATAANELRNLLDAAEADVWISPEQET